VGSGGEDRPDASAVIAALRGARTTLIEGGPAPGRAWCRAWSDEVDAAVVELAREVVGTPASRQLTVAAVGGYGRRELCPASDVDLLLLHDGAEAEHLEAAVRAVVYPLWDVGLRVGYAVRDRREAIGATDDLDAATAMLDLRILAGAEGFAQGVRAEVLRRLRRRPHRFLGALRRADRDRHLAAGGGAEVIEPDLKSGAGGLRDVQSLRWAAAALVGTPGLDPLVAAGYLGAADRGRLARAEDEVLRVRVTLHLVQHDLGGGLAPSGSADVLRLDVQEAVAGRLGFEDRAAHELAPHRLLRSATLAARTIDHAHQRAWRLIDADVDRGQRRRGRPTERVVDGFELVDGVLRLPVDAELDGPDLPGRLLVTLADTGAVLDRASADRLRRHAETVTEEGAGGWRWSDPERQRVLSVLWRGRVALPALAELDDAGVLAAVLPEWEPLRGRPQRSPYHRYTLDRHAWHTVAQLADLVRREPWAAEALEEVDDREGLLLGALLHDVGKVAGEPHEETGVPIARALAGRMLARPGTVDLVERLVRLHLLLPETARRRDVTDPVLAAELADRIGDRATLAALHLLAAADGRATGPVAWSSWTASLVGTLVTKVRAVFDEQHPDEVADGAVATVREAQRLAPELGTDAESVRAHLALLPNRYANAVSARGVVRHTLMVANPPGPTEVRTRVTPGNRDRPAFGGVDTALEDEETAATEAGPLDELDVIAHDHPGWFAKVAGVVSLHGGSIAAADAFTREDGLAVDTFRVRPPAGAGGSWWAAVEGDLAEAAAGRLAVRARVLRKARADDRRVARLPRIPTTVTASPSSTRATTLVEVHALDRLGVLYAIAAAFAELELDLVVARVQTLGHEVVDVFELRDAEGGPLDADHVAELELAVRAAIDEL
jgi:[protein-PII] uridylyltransferase